MRYKLLCLVFLLLLAMTASAAPPKSKLITDQAAQIDNDTYIDVNNILMFVTNHGNFGRDLGGRFGKDAGTFFPYATVKEIESGLLDDWVIFASGLWIGGKVGTQTRVVISEFDSEYGPGPMANGTYLSDESAFKVYKIYRDSLANNPNADYTNWPVNQGAPSNPDGSPKLIGDQMLWSVFNDANPAGHANDAGSTNPLGIEVKSTVFGFDRQGALGNIIFLRYRIYNKGNNTIDNCYISLWSDPDLGDAGDDFVGCDSTIGLGFVYNSDNDDANHYGDKAPAVGYDFFQGPLDSTGNIADTAIMWDTVWPGNVNLGMVSFNKYINGTDPNDFTESYAFMQGLAKDTSGVIVPYVFNGDTLLYQQSGDPVAGTGDLDVLPSDRRFMLSTGPITFAPGDSTEILAAVVVGQGANNLNSITIMKQIDVFAQNLYENGFNPPRPPAAPIVEIIQLDGEIVLAWGDTSQIDQGDYPFEGYTVYQGESPTGPWTELITSDLIDKDNPITSMVDTVSDPVLGDVPILLRLGSESGLAQSYETTKDALSGLNLRDHTEYYFRVSAFSYADTAQRGAKFLENGSVVTVIPTRAGAGITLNNDFGDGEQAVHSLGGSQGSVSFSVVDPRAVTGDNYRVGFTDFWVNFVDSVDSMVTPWDTTVVPDTIVGVVWHLTNTTTGDTILVNQTNQGLEGPDAYMVADGLKVITSGPQPGILSFEVSANGAGPLDPVEPGAFDFQNYPTPVGTGPTPGRPNANQQVGEGMWGFNTGDNGGTSGGGTQASYEQFIIRTFRADPDRLERLGSYDWEMRFTGDTANGAYDSSLGGGGYAWAAFTSGAAIWVPFELWRIGVGTPNDPSDDVRLIPWIVDDEGDSLYWMSSYGSDLNGNCGFAGCEHSASGGDNDPYTDWIYWAVPADASGNLLDSPGDAAYQTFATAMETDPVNWAGNELRVMDRTVLVSWNGDTTGNAQGGATVPSGYNQDLPEPGTVFRLVTAKANSPADEFTFSTTSATTAQNEDALKNIKTVPNPFYLFGPYEADPRDKAVKFINLPLECTITIYNLAGDKVRTLEHTLADAQPTEITWNTLTFNNVPVASGIYIYVVDAPGYGQKIGKMAIFTEVETLQRF